MSWFHAAPGTVDPPRLAPRPAPPEPSLDAQALWFAVQRRGWSTLALVPAEAGCSTMPVAMALAEVIAAHRGRPPLVLPGESLDLAGSAALLAQLRMRAPGEAAHDPVLVPLGSFSDFPSGVAVARAVDAVLLCVELRRTRLRAAKEAIGAAGRDKLLGYVVLQKKKGRR